MTAVVDSTLRQQEFYILFWLIIMRLHHISLPLAAAAACFMISCTMSNKTFQDSKFGFYQERDVEVPSGRLTPEVMWQLANVGAPVVSPDGHFFLYTISRTDIAEDKTVTELYVMPTNGQQQPVRLTDAKDGSVSQPAFVPNTNRIAFLRKDEKTKATQLFTVDYAGEDLVCLTNMPNGVDGFLFSPDGQQIVLTSTVKLDQDIHDLYPDLPKADALIEDDLMYRHWDSWADGCYSHLFVANVTDNALSNMVDIMEGEKFHSPLRPFGGMEQVAWGTDGIYYTCKKLQGKESAESTNSDIYYYTLSDGKTINITSPNKGYDTNPVFVNGSLFHLSMKNEGYESDKNRIFLREANGNVVDLTEGSELYVSEFIVSPDAKQVWFVADSCGRDAIFLLQVASREIIKVTQDDADYSSMALAADCLLALRTSLVSPADVYAIDGVNGTRANLTQANKQTLSKIAMPKVTEHWIPTTDGKQMLTWVLLPPDFDTNASAKYPALLYCQGGPQSTVSQFWSKRWNLALMASNGYVVVAPNRRGLPGFGIEWNEQISKDYGGQNMKDYLSAIDNVSAEPYVDADRLGCVGASYGGFSVYWLAGHHQKRFKVFLAHCGIFNFDQLYATTEELFFVNWEMGGAFWDKANPVAMNSFAQSPHLFVGEWDTPIMVVHGQKDFRIPYTQGMAAFNVAKMRGIPARFLYFPDECHWVQHPQNSILWHREFFRWLDQWLK